MSSDMNTPRVALRFLGWAALALFAAGSAGSTLLAAEAPMVLENGQVSLEIDPAFGTITRILDKTSRIDLATSPALAENFRMVLLMPDKKAVPILGKDQKLSNIKRTSDGLVLNWNGPLKDTAGVDHNVVVRMDVKVVGGELQFGLHLDNGSAHKVKEAWYPMIGGLSKFGAPGQPADGVIWVPITNPLIKRIEFPFGSAAIGYPGQANMSFTCVQSAAARKSLYFASHDTIARYKVYHFQEHGKDEAKDVFACIQHLPYTPPGKTFDGSTVVLRVVDGDWRAAGRVYREFFTNAFGLADPKTDWIRKQSFFLFTMFMLPEGTINYTFKDIPRWAKAAKDHGVNAVQISGWETCGHDNGLPYYTPDPRLGTWKDLEDGVRACHEMGLKVFFFVNFQQMTIDTGWYKSELEKYREWREDGDLTWRVGWGYGTLWSRSGHPKLMTKADLGYPQFRKIIVDQFEALAKIGADGVHVDKMFPESLSFNPDSPMGPDVSTWEGAVLLSKEVFAACRKHNPNWSMSFECNWDCMLQFGGCTWWVGNQLITRSVFPEHAETLAVNHAYDYLVVNNAVRGGHHVLVAPLKFSGGMDSKPMQGLNEHIRNVKRIQDRLQETVFLGEVLGHDGVKLAGQPAQGVEYNVFRNRRTALAACIVTNATMRPQSATLEGFDGAKSPSVRVHQPGQESHVVDLPASITIPAEQILFVEQLAEKTTPTAPSDPPRLSIARIPDDEPVPELPPFDAARSIRLEDEHILIDVRRDNGSVTRIHDKNNKLDMILEPRLAGSWKFAFPLPGKEWWQTIEANWIIGSQQKLSSVQVDGKRMVLTWDGPLKNYLGENYDASVTETIELADGGAIFNLAIKNRTPYQVGETYFPVLGGIRGLGASRGHLLSTQFVHPTANGSVATVDIFRTFVNMSFGGDVPEQFYTYPETLPEPWIALQSVVQPARLVYLGAHDPLDRKKVAQLQLFPSHSSLPREDGNWPRPYELKGLPAGVEFSFVDCMGGEIGKDYQAAPVFVRFYDGDWRQAKDIYKRWKDKNRP